MERCFPACLFRTKSKNSNALISSSAKTDFLDCKIPKQIEEAWIYKFLNYVAWSFFQFRTLRYHKWEPACLYAIKMQDWRDMSLLLWGEKKLNSKSTNMCKSKPSKDMWEIMHSNLHADNIQQNRHIWFKWNHCSIKFRWKSIASWACPPWKALDWSGGAVLQLKFPNVVTRRDPLCYNLMSKQCVTIKSIWWIWCQVPIAWRDEALEKDKRHVLDCACPQQVQYIWYLDNLQKQLPASAWHHLLSLYHLLELTYSI